MRKPKRTGLVLFALTLLSIHSLAGQFPPDSFVNLQVLPQDIQWRDLQRLMRGFNSAIGTTGCLYCHVGERGTPQSEWNFPSDDKLTKRKAREMLRMVRAMNSEHMARLPGPTEPRVEVTCTMCHMSRSVPRELRFELINAYAAGGIDSLVQRYRHLRMQYYERGAYDFSEFTLRWVAQQIRAQGNLHDAIAAVQLNAEVNPGEWEVVRRLAEYRLEAEALERGGAAAVALYQKLRRGEQDERYYWRAWQWSILNNVGYRLLAAERTAEAVAVFRLNVERYPRDWEVYDSLGEGYAANGDTALAIEQYERSVEMNPENTGGLRALERLRG